MTTMSSAYHRWHAAETRALAEERRVHAITLTADHSPTPEDRATLGELRAQAHARFKEYVNTMANYALDLTPH